MAHILDLNDKKNCKEFVEAVSNGAVFAYPTEAVFGLGCDITNKNAIQKILDLKKRDVTKGLIVISDNLEKVRGLIDGDYFKNFSDNNSDTTPTTWLCPANNIVSPEITGSSKKIAIRITRHETSCEICKLLNMPIVSTSANIAGEKPIIKMNQLENYFGNKIDYIVEGQIGNNKQPSRILDLLTHEVLREGD